MPTFLECVKPSQRGLPIARVRKKLATMPTDPDKPYTDIGQRLLWHRKLLGVDQAGYVQPLKGIKRGAYSNWETGASRLSLNGALEIRRVYGLSLDFMFVGNSDALALSLRNEWLSRPLESHSQ